MLHPRRTLVVAMFIVAGSATAMACGSSSSSDDGSSSSGAREVPTPGSASPGPRDGTDAGAAPISDAGPDVAVPCTPRDSDAMPKAATYSTKIAGRDAWVHDPGFASGYFHTFDGLSLGSGFEAGARKVHVFLPRSYASGACTKYPVLYFHDGDTTFFPDGAVGKTWDVASVLASSYAAKAFGEVIVVAVVPLQRDREYTHAPWRERRTCCGVGEYVTWLTDALKPFVDGAYRTHTGPDDTVIIGSSHGGLAAFYTAATRPDVFGKAIAMSSSFWAGLDDATTGGPLATSALMQAVGPKLATKRPRLYLDWGLVRTGGDHNAVIEERATTRGREMASLLVASYGYTLGQDLFTVEDPQGEHEEISWGRRLGSALTSVLGP